MGILVFIIMLLSYVLAILSICLGWTTVNIIILAISGLLAVINTIITFARGSIVGGILSIIISIAVPFLGAWGLSHLCWDFWCWASVLIPASVVITNVLTSLAN